MLVTNYTMKVKEIYDALGSINVMVDEDEMVHIRTTISTREKPPSFFDLQSMLMVEENHAGGSRTTQSDSWMLHTEAEEPHGRGGRGGLARNSGTDKSRKEGIEEVPTAVPYPPLATGVKAA